MKDYFLVIDTETSGLPKRWDVPYNSSKNWPHVVQIAWVIYDANNLEIKRENHYLKNGDFKITTAAFNIHQISHDFLLKNGEDSKEILELLMGDLKQYEPLVVAHFMELDFHMVNVEFFRAQINYSLHKHILFCTMLASVPYIKNPTFKFLKLGRFYKTLFGVKPDKQHHALFDALLTADIFFNLLKKGEIDDLIIENQQAIIKRSAYKNRYPYILPILMLLIIALLIWLWYER